MTNAQSKMMRRINYLPPNCPEMTNWVRSAGLASKYGRKIRVKIEEEQDNGDAVGFWNRAVKEKCRIFTTN